MPAIQKEVWGRTHSGETVHLYTLRGPNGLEASIANYGGHLVTLKTPDREGKVGDVVLGFRSLDGYLAKNPYFGAIVGRYANRLANGVFTLDGKAYHVSRNSGENSLHGGIKGFDKALWKAHETTAGANPALRLEYVSADGEEGYPGTLSVIVDYVLDDNRGLRIDYHATTDRDTVLNLTNHSYFDLSGEETGDIEEYQVLINADSFTPVNEHLLPTGELRPVEGTPFDFRQPTRIGSRIDDEDEQLRYGIGYDHNFVLNRKEGELSLAARVFDPHSGRILEVLTTQPGVQFYTGNHLDGTVIGKKGVAYGFRSGVCFETQHFPDSPNHPEFPSTVLRPGEEFRSTTIYRFPAE